MINVAYAYPCFGFHGPLCTKGLCKDTLDSVLYLEWICPTERRNALYPVDDSSEAGPPGDGV